MIPLLRPLLLAATVAAPILATPALADAQELVQQRVAPTSADEVRLSFAPVVKRVMPAVVNVFASRMVATRPASPFFDDPFFRRFFGDDGGGPQRRMQSSLGSGVIVSADGLVVTNNHVVAGADEVKVALADRREFDAKVVLKDDRADLAVLKIDDPTGKLPVVLFADSDALEVGDIVLALGNPFGVGQTVTQGIVSAVARTQVGITDYQFFIQTDAAINPGNSGGALVDMAGELVGINTAIYSRDGGSNGIGFAIPANMVRLVVDAARSGGVVRRPWLGATFQVVTGDIAEGLGLDRPHGALVTAVVPRSPAEAAGLKVGDLVVSVDNIAVDDPDSFGYRFMTKGVGGRAMLGVVRDGAERMVAVELAPAPETVPRDPRKLAGRSPLAGATVMNLSPAVADELKVPASKSGVVVAEVAEGSPAAMVGFQAGDVVLEINGEAVATSQALEEIVRGRPPAWRLSIDRRGQVMQLALRG